MRSFLPAKKGKRRKEEIASLFCTPFLPHPIISTYPSPSPFSRGQLFDFPDMMKTHGRPTAHHHLILKASLSLRPMELFALASWLQASPDSFMLHVAWSQHGQTAGILPGVTSPQGRGFARVPGSYTSELGQHGTFLPSAERFPILASPHPPQRVVKWGSAAENAHWCSWGEGGSLLPICRVLCSGEPLAQHGVLLPSAELLPFPRKSHGEGAPLWLRVSSSAPLSVEESAASFMDTWRRWKNDLTSPRDLQKWREV